VSVQKEKQKICVVGLGCGDEGKGVVTEYLCSQNPKNTAVVRFSGGHQCGHKVVKGAVEHVFANFGSGTLSGCPTYWSEHCTFEPVGFWKEYSLLREKGIESRIWIHPECPVTTIYDVFMNRRSDSVERDHGTTGTGFFRTKKRHQDGVVFTAGDLLGGSIKWVDEKLRSIRSYFDIPDDLDLTPFLEAADRIRQLIGCGVLLSRHPVEYLHMVFEGSQGLLLDQHIGYFPHVTPSDVTPRNALVMAGRLDEVWLVSRVYQTRHGAGPITNTEHTLSLKNNEKETNKLDKYQGEFRVSILDLDQLLYAKAEGIDKIVSASTRVNLVMTCADQIDSYKISVNGDVIVFDDVDDFVRFVGSSLKISGDLYVNTSPCSTTIKRIGSGTI